MSKFIPINDRILLRVKSEEKKTSTGIILPSEHVTAEVIATGPGAVLPTHHNESAAPLRLAPSVRPGDVVALPKRYKEHCEEVLHEGALHYVATEQVVLGLLEG